jgi:hypothetical protein
MMKKITSISAFIFTFLSFLSLSPLAFANQTINVNSHNWNSNLNANITTSGNEVP